MSYFYIEKINNYKSALAVIDEMNDKWNALCEMFPMEVLIRNGFRTFMYEKLGVSKETADSVRKGWYSVKLKKLFKALRECRPFKGKNRIKWRIRFFVDDYDYLFSLLPTIVFVPWPFRHIGTPVVEIVWLNFGIRIGEWNARK